MDRSMQNWQRWGPADQIGQLNLMTPDRILSAVKLVRKGKLYNLAVPLERNGPQFPTFHKTRQVTYCTNNRDPGSINVVDDFLALESHSGTHIDALGHFFQDRRMWNGASADGITAQGLNWAGIDNVKGFVARGVMLDLPKHKGVDHLGLGELVTVEQMERCASAQGVSIDVGDILLLRTGWHGVFKTNRSLYEQGEPGPDISCAPWLKQKDIIALGADNYAVEQLMIDRHDHQAPMLHTVVLRDLGIYLVENLDLDELARDQVYEFLFVAAPLRLPGASGAPFSPIALV